MKFSYTKALYFIFLANILMACSSAKPTINSIRVVTHQAEEVAQEGKTIKYFKHKSDNLSIVSTKVQSFATNSRKKIKMVKGAIKIGKGLYKFTVDCQNASSFTVEPDSKDAAQQAKLSDQQKNSLVQAVCSKRQ